MSATSQLIDARGPQFGAALTTIVLALVLLTAPSVLGLALLAGQALFFLIGATLGVQRTPWGQLFKRAVRPRLSPTTKWEDARPPRFAQGVGLSGAESVGAIAVGFALAAALLNAAFGFCLGCELYLRLQRLAPARRVRVPVNV